GDQSPPLVANMGRTERYGSSVGRDHRGPSPVGLPSASGPAHWPGSLPPGGAPGQPFSPSRPSRADPHPLAAGGNPLLQGPTGRAPCRLREPVAVQPGVPAAVRRPSAPGRGGAQGRVSAGGLLWGLAFSRRHPSPPRSGRRLPARRGGTLAGRGGPPPGSGTGRPPARPPPHCPRVGPGRTRRSSPRGVACDASATDVLAMG